MFEMVAFGLIGYCIIGCVIGIISVLKNEKLIKISNDKNIKSLKFLQFFG